jgi:hypothetical protein
MKTMDPEMIRKIDSVLERVEEPESNLSVGEQTDPLCLRQYLRQSEGVLFCYYQADRSRSHEARKERVRKGISRTGRQIRLTVMVRKVFPPERIFSAVPP